MLEKTLASPLDCKEIQPVQPKGDQSWVFIGRTDLETEVPMLWPPDAKNWLSFLMERTMKLGKIECLRRRGWQRMRWLDDITDAMDMSLSSLQEIVKDGEVWCAAVHGITKSQSRLSKWTTTTTARSGYFVFEGKCASKLWRLRSHYLLGSMVSLSDVTI